MNPNTAPSHADISQPVASYTQHGRDGGHPARASSLSSRLALRPRGVLEIFDLALRFMTLHWRLYAPISAVFIFPIWVVHSLLAHFVSQTAAVVFWLPASVLIRAFYTLLASKLVFEDALTLRRVLAALWEAKGRIFSYVMAYSLLALIILGIAQIDEAAVIASMSSIIALPVMAIGLSGFFGLESALLERAGFFAGLKRSRSLVSSGTGEAVGGGILLLLLHGASVILGDVAGRSILTDLLMVRAPEPLFSAGLGPLSLLGFWVVAPFIATTRFLLYINVRTVIEGWDIQTHFAKAAARMEEELA